MNSKKIKKISLLIFIVFFAMSGTFSYAQITNDDITLKASPKIPGPNKSVSLKLISYALDLDRAKISWYEDDELVLSGTGETYYSFTMKNIGLNTKFDIYIQSGGSKQFQISKTFISSTVDLLWEATRSYTPPFYKGKALPASQEIIRITAVPNVTSTNGTKANPNRMIYKWKKNGKYRDLNNQSGYNKKSVIFKQSLFNSIERVSVEVSSENRDSFSEGTTLIKRVQPEILVYDNHPLEGIIYEQTINGDFFMENKEVEITAEPYYFSSYNKSTSDMIFKWRAGNKKITSGELSSDMVFGFEKDTIGSSNISLEITHIDNILQFAKTSFRLRYGEDGSFFNTVF